MLIFAEENVPEVILMHLFLITLFYIQTVSNITKKDIMEIAQALPTQYEKQVKVRASMKSATQ
jgi:hypothetical protein